MTRAHRRGGERPPALPAWLLPLAGLALLYLLLPLVALTTRAPWTRLPAVLATEAASEALTLSLLTCGIALLVDLLVGVPLALLLARNWRGVRAVRVLVALPLSVPPVVAGLALLLLFGRRGPLGALLDAAGVTLAFTPIAVVMAQVFVSLPFLVLTVEAALRARPSGLETVAASLGASPTRVLTRVTLPLLAPALARGAALALARCLGEFGATLTFAGSLSGVTRTMPLEVYLARESDPDLALALGVVLLAAALLVVTLTEVRLPRWRRRQGEGRGGASASREALSSRAVQAARAEERSAAEVVRGRGARREAAAHVGEGRLSAPVAHPAHPLAIRLSGEVKARNWRMDCEIPAGRTVAVMGHNGAGKSTLAALIAGTLALDDGTLTLGSRLVDGPGTYVPSSRRPIALLGQSPLLFPHLSVLDNVAFPLRSRGIRRRHARALALAELRACECAHLASRRAHALSGGEAARVGLARALVARPGVLILDEPTAALDVEASAQMLTLLASRLNARTLTTVLITHDVPVALALADDLLVLEDGRLAERGAPAEVLAAPTSHFGARLAGLNVVTGVVEESADHLVGMPVGDGVLTAYSAEAHPTVGERVSFLFAPEAVTLHAGLPGPSSSRSVLAGLVRGVRDEGGVVLVELELAGGGPRVRARVTAAAWAEFAAVPGLRVWCAVKATQIRVVPHRGKGPSPAAMLPQ